MDEVKLYFAYGSNLCKEQMKVRCPKSKYLEKYYFDNYKLCFGWNGLPAKPYGVANIIKDGSKADVKNSLFSKNKNDISAYKKIGNMGVEVTLRLRTRSFLVILYGKKIFLNLSFSWSCYCPVSKLRRVSL